MHAHVSLWSYFLKASFPIQFIFIVLFVASIATWTFIFHRIALLRSVNKAYKQFEKEFWSDIKLTELYEELPDAIPPEHLSAVFYAGFTEFCRLRNSGCQTLRVILEGVSRAMNMAKAQAELNLERHLSWVAIVASSAPYLGLIGTLWGIVSAISALDMPQPNSLLLVAPGVAEALMISLVSLFTSVPALIFYHSYISHTDKLLTQYHIFQEEFIALLLRQAYEEQNEKLPVT